MTTLATTPNITIRPVRTPWRMRVRRPGPAWVATAAKMGSGVPAGGGRRGAGAGGEVLDEGPPGQRLGGGDLRGEGACGLQGEAGGQVDTFVAGQLSSQSREGETDGSLVLLAGGVRALVADSARVICRWDRRMIRHQKECSG